MVFPSAKNIYHVHSKSGKASALVHFVQRLFFRNLINIIRLKTAIMLPQCNRGSFTTQNRLFYRAKEPVLIYRGVEIFWSMGIMESWFPHGAKCLSVMEGLFAPRLHRLSMVSMRPKSRLFKLHAQVPHNKAVDVGLFL